MRNGIAARHLAVAACASFALACGREEPGVLAAPQARSAVTDEGVAGATAPAIAERPADPGALGDLEAILQTGAPEPDALLTAIARVGESGDRRAPALLTPLVLDPAGDDAVRARAAVALAQVDPRAATAALQRLDPWVLSAALDHVRGIPFSDSEPFFRALLGAPISQDAKREAIAALADSSTEAASLLVEVASRAPDPALRATAVDAIAFMPDAGEAPIALATLPAHERAPEVRASLYRVLTHYAGALPPGPGSDALLRSVLAERDPAVRLEGCALVAELVRAHDDAKARESFERVLVPWLAREAVRGASRPARLRAVAALGLAGGAPAAEALAKLADSREPEVADAARTALASR